MNFKSIRIRMDGKQTQIFIDGEDVAKECVSYRVEQYAGGYAKVTLEQVHWTKDLEISGVCLIEDKKTEEKGNGK